MRAGSAFQNLQSITILLFSLKRFFPKNDLSKINTQSIKLYLSKKLSLFFKKNINKIKTKKFFLKPEKVLKRPETHT